MKKHKKNSLQSLKTGTAGWIKKKPSPSNQTKRVKEVVP